MKTNNISLQFASNMTGKLNPTIIKRINKFMRKPSSDTWDDISSIIISFEGKMPTIWNAVIELCPFFPTWGRRTNYKGDIIRDWEQIPTPEEVNEAIKKIVFKEILNAN
jgi:hypothetical protein